MAPGMRLAMLHVQSVKYHLLLPPLFLDFLAKSLYALLPENSLERGRGHSVVI